MSKRRAKSPGPSYPLAPTKEEARAAIAKRTKPPPPPPDVGVIAAFPPLLAAILRRLAGGVVSSSSAGSVSASAVLLICFCVVHAAGNLAAFGGPETLNAYGHKLHAMGWLLTIVEAYLALGFVAHVASASFLTLKHGNANPRRSSWTRARLAASGSVILAFLVLHLKDVRFGPWYTTTLSDGAVARDLWKLQAELFASPLMVAWYCISSATLCFHLFWGWPKTVKKPTGLAGAKLERPAYTAAITIGNAMAVGLTAAFIAAPIYTHLAR